MADQLTHRADRQLRGNFDALQVDCLEQRRADRDELVHVDADGADARIERQSDFGATQDRSTVLHLLLGARNLRLDRLPAAFVGIHTALQILHLLTQLQRLLLLGIDRRFRDQLALVDFAQATKLGFTDLEILLRQLQRSQSRLLFHLEFAQRRAARFQVFLGLPQRQFVIIRLDTHHQCTLRNRLARLQVRMQVADLAAELGHAVERDRGLDVAIGGDARAKRQLPGVDHFHRAARHLHRNMLQRLPVFYQHDRNDNRNRQRDRQPCNTLQLEIHSACCPCEIANIDDVQASILTRSASTGPRPRSNRMQSRGFP